MPRSKTLKPSSRQNTPTPPPTTTDAQRLTSAHHHYSTGHYLKSLSLCSQIYHTDASNIDNLLLLSALHFQLKNLSESLFYAQQALRVNPSCAEAYVNAGNCLAELGDDDSAIDFYTKAIRLRPRFGLAYSHLAGVQFRRQKGDWREAVSSYELAISLFEEDDASENRQLSSDALTNLGNLYRSMGRREDAERCHVEAVRVNPRCAIAWSNLGGVFSEGGESDKANESYKQAVRLAPLLADAYSNWGNALMKEGVKMNDEEMIEGAMAKYEKATSLRPDFALGHGNMALVHYRRGEMEDARRLLHRALLLEPKYTDALNNLGCVYARLGRLDDAVKVLLRAVRLKPDHVYAYNNLGNILKDMGLVQEALHCYTMAVKLMPDFTIAKCNLGVMFEDQKQFERSLQFYHEAVKTEPFLTEAYVNMGNVYRKLGRNVDALKCYNHAHKSKPTCPKICANIASAHEDQGNLSEAIQWFRKAIATPDGSTDEVILSQLIFLSASLCDWSTIDDDTQTIKKIINKTIALDDDTTVSSSPMVEVQPFHAQIMTPPIDGRTLFEISKAAARRVEQNITLLDTKPFIHHPHQQQPPPDDNRIKVGYLSSHFGQTPIGYLTQSLYQHHNKQTFQIYCYATTPNDDSPSYNNLLQNETITFRDITHHRDNDAATLVHDDGIHILINLDGYTHGARNEIFALRPAPVQITMMGHGGTMGATFMDYIVADEVVIDESRRRDVAERVLYAPGGCLALNDHKRAARFIGEDDEDDFDSSELRAVYGISDDVFVYACFNQSFKIDPGLFAVWMEILKHVERSVLVLVQFNTVMEGNLKQRAMEMEVDPERLIFLPVVSIEDQIRRCRLADLILDTRSCGGLATSCDALWAGVPMISMQGEKLCNRVGASLLKAVGLEELIVEDTTDYARLAVELNDDEERYIGIIRKLEDVRETSRLFDTERWVRGFERGLKQAVMRYWSGQEPEHIYCDRLD